MCSKLMYSFFILLTVYLKIILTDIKKLIFNDVGTQPKHLGAAVVEMRTGSILGVTRFVQV